jgi:serine/threonine-protein kinase ATR
VQSKQSESPWGKFLDSCHTAVRTPAGIHVAEFILPLLILNRICFGDDDERRKIQEEIIDLLEFKSTLSHPMLQTERQKAVNTMFMVIDTLSYWCEHEEEEKYRLSRKSTSRSRRNSETIDLTENDSGYPWSSDISTAKISDLLGGLSLSLQAKAAAAVDMHARALRLLEMDSRRQVVNDVFGAEPSTLRFPFDVGKIDQCLLKIVLGELYDSETMSALNIEVRMESPISKVLESIRQKEAEGDWEAALQDYEMAMQLDHTPNKAGDLELRKGSLQCLVEIGHFDSVLNQVKGMVKLPGGEAGGVAHLGVQAAWRLGRWDDLSALLQEARSDKSSANSSVDLEGYETAIGDAIFSLKNGKSESTISSIKDARNIVMQNLAGAARESYSRSYPDLVRLQCLREIENANHYFSSTDLQSIKFSEITGFDMGEDSWAWKGRLELASSQGIGHIIGTRIALARIATDHDSEGWLFLELGRKARKNGHFAMAANYFSQAEAAAKRAIVPDSDYDNRTESLKKFNALIYPLNMQVAKLKHAIGDSSSALRLLGQDEMQKAHDMMMPLLVDDKEGALISLATQFELEQARIVVGSKAAVEDDSKVLVDRFVRRLLKLTSWNVDGGLKGGAEIKARFRTILKLAPEWEKGKDQLLQSPLMNFSLP